MARPAPVRSGRSAACPCGLTEPYEECCGALHGGRRTAATAEELMRSRYSAYVVRDADYLLRSWAPVTRPRSVEFDEDLVWTGLEILGRTGGSAFHTEGTVEFRASCVLDGQPGVLREDSRFVRRADGGWLYERAR